MIDDRGGTSGLPEARGRVTPIAGAQVGTQRVIEQNTGDHEAACVRRSSPLPALVTGVLVRLLCAAKAIAEESRGHQCRSGACDTPPGYA